MQCSRCKVEMINGTCIDPKYDMSRHITFFSKSLQAHEIKIVSCLKCPSCGNSDSHEERTVAE